MTAWNGYGQFWDGAPTVVIPNETVRDLLGVEPIELTEDDLEEFETNQIANDEFLEGYDDGEDTSVELPGPAKETP